MEKEEYELVPLNPIRKLEKKIEELEAGTKATKISNEMLDILKTNQEIVDNLVKANSELVRKIGELTVSVESLTKRLDELIERIDIGTTETNEEKTESELSQRLDKLEKRINTLLLSKVPKEKWAELKRKHVG